jgi:hypothetical protein
MTAQPQPHTTIDEQVETLLTQFCEVTGTKDAVITEFPEKDKGRRAEAFLITCPNDGGKLAEALNTLKVPFGQKHAILPNGEHEDTIALFMQDLLFEPNGHRALKKLEDTIATETGSDPDIIAFHSLPSMDEKCTKFAGDKGIQQKLYKELDSTVWTLTDGESEAKDLYYMQNSSMPYRGLNLRSQVVAQSYVREDKAAELATRLGSDAFTARLENNGAKVNITGTNKPDEEGRAMTMVKLTVDNPEGFFKSLRECPYKEKAESAVPPR